MMYDVYVNDRTSKYAPIVRVEMWAPGKYIAEIRSVVAPKVLRVLATLKSHNRKGVRFNFQGDKDKAEDVFITAVCGTYDFSKENHVVQGNLPFYGGPYG